MGGGGGGRGGNLEFVGKRIFQSVNCLAGHHCTDMAQSDSDTA